MSQFVYTCSCGWRGIALDTLFASETLRSPLVQALAELAGANVEVAITIRWKGVPLPMGRALAKAVRQAMGYPAPPAAVDPPVERTGTDGSTRVQNGVAS